MALRNILIEGDSLLRKRSREITEITDRIKTLAEDMWETLCDADGVGLAAPQVGVLRRLVVIDVTRPEPEEEEEEEETDAGIENQNEEKAEGEGEEETPETNGKQTKFLLINPEIIEVSEETITGNEGCLSVPGMVGVVTRFMRIKVRALDLEGNEFELEGEGLLAKALQHEIDHLDGVLYIDIAESVTSVQTEPEPEENSE